MGVGAANYGESYYVEYNPHMDNKGLQTGRLVRRTAIAIMTGIAMNAMGMDPEYVNPHHTGDSNK